MTLRPAVVFLAAAAALSAACTGGGRPGPVVGTPSAAPAHVRVQLAGGAVRDIPLETYVRGTIIAEFAPASGDIALVERMLQVQSIIARTYAVAHRGRHGRDGFDLCSTTHCQLYDPARLTSSRWADAAGTAAAATSGQVLWFGSSPANALFHADCGGHTSAGESVWGGTPWRYLAAAADDGPAEGAHAAWRFEVEQGKLVDVLNRDARTRVGAALAAISVMRRDAGGRAELVVLQGTREPVVRGEELRAVMTRTFGARSIRSTRFDVTRSGRTFVFTGQGFGHGVGLCQVGAVARLRAGARPEQVLSRYYPGTTIVALR